MTKDTAHTRLDSTRLDSNERERGLLFIYSFECNNYEQTTTTILRRIKITKALLLTEIERREKPAI